MCKRMHELEKKKNPDTKDDTADCTQAMDMVQKADPNAMKCMMACADKADFEAADKCMDGCQPKKPEAASSAAP